MDDIMKIVKSLEGCGLLIKGVSKSIKNEVNEQKGGFLSMLLHTLEASLLGNLLIGKGVKAEIPGRGVITAGEGQGAMSPNSLTNFEIQRYYQK